MAIAKIAIKTCHPENFSGSARPMQGRDGMSIDELFKLSA